jgi:hypothetical protein
MYTSLNFSNVIAKKSFISQIRNLIYQFDINLIITLKLNYYFLILPLLCKYIKKNQIIKY